MSIRIIHDEEVGRAVIYNSTYERAWPPVILGRCGYDAYEVAELFAAYAESLAMNNGLSSPESLDLMKLYGRFVATVDTTASKAIAARESENE